MSKEISRRDFIKLLSASTGTFLLASNGLIPVSGGIVAAQDAALPGTFPREQTLIIRQLTGREEISRMFEWQLELLAERNANIQPNDLLGKDITIELETQGGGRRFLNGQVTRFAFVGKEVAKDTDLWRYEARLRPWLWYMTRESDFKIFQNMTVPDILAAVFAKYPFPVAKRLEGSYKHWDYCVQYHETDFNFVSRLMEHEGIYYFFEHEMGRHTLVLADAIGAHSPCPGYASVPYIPHDRIVTADEECIEERDLLIASGRGDSFCPPLGGEHQQRKDDGNNRDRLRVVEILLQHLLEEKTGEPGRDGTEKDVFRQPAFC